ncbi:uncharacterized protein EI97DRAFT_440201 [Westerdykella ornata]|uniref:Uncharacterized protein n=1 Tax=Westerdykella ornata TaxID=318751 RepID=A0A6A6JQZ4_WESOR|nr:uncharacterized protein EI97DRAFT_440201 [Westerdykella ornata]KAF2278664.1 hypothetical protein EI97DRAFT_440201 [Westerdykella ornata]
MGMSQHPTDRPHDGHNDPFSTAFNPNTPSSLEQLDSSRTDYFFGHCDGNYYLTPSQTPSSNNDLVPDFDFSTTLFPETTSYSNASSACQTPEYTGFNNHSEFHSSLQASTYPSTPAPGTPHPYPIQDRHHVDFSSFGTVSTQRPQLFRSATNNTHLHPPTAAGYHHLSRTNQPLHRRSLSQSDADRIAALYSHAHPLPHPSRRAISTDPDDNAPLNSKKPGCTKHNNKTDNSNPSRPGPYTKPSSHGQHKKRRSHPPTSTPLGMGMRLSGSCASTGSGARGPALVRELNPPGRLRSMYTCIGTPLNLEDDALDEDTSAVRVDAGAEIERDTRVQLTGPRMRHMSHAEQLRTSAKVIEIGAMAVLNAASGGKGGQQGMVGEEAEVQSNDEVLRLVDKMESHLKLQDVGDRDKGLRGCEMIREALGEGGGLDEGGGKMEVGESTLKDSSMSTQTDLQLDTGDADLLALLQNDLEANGFTTAISN